MKSTSFKIATIRGIPIRIHFSFLLVLPLLAYIFSRVFREAARVAEVPPEQLGGSPWVWGLGLAVALFLSVLLHELAHSLYALKKGGKVRDITLLMIGGVSQIYEMPRESKHEAMMAFVGPLVSVLLGVAIYGVHLALAQTPSFHLRFAFFYLAGLNVFLGVFNLLPAFPMDGGRILRSLLSRRMGPVRATRIASGFGKGFAVLFGIWGFVSLNFLLLLIAFFVYMGAESENRSVLMKSMIGKLRVRDLMNDRVVTLPAQITVYDAAERMLRERQLAFAAMSNDEVLGLVTLEGVQRVPRNKRQSTLAREIATPAPEVSPEDDVSQALRVMTESNLTEVAVTRAGQLVGSIGRDDIARGLKLSELQATQRPSAPAGASGEAGAQAEPEPRGESRPGLEAWKLPQGIAYRSGGPGSRPGPNGPDRS